MTLFSPARKEQLKARVALDGPTGSGKTWTALQWARILAGQDGAIGVVDTENRSAAYYAAAPGATAERLNWWDPPYEFGHMPIAPPYDPRELARIIKAAGVELGPDGVLVIDSLTHYWSGEGGTLGIVDDAASRARGNTYAGWKEGTPAQQMMLDAIIHASCHVITTMRSKMEYVLEVGPNGKQVPRKIGLAPVQRAGVEYEFTVVADMDLEHRLIVSKSRCSEIADAVAPAGRSADVAATFAAWLNTGAEPTPEPEPAPDGPSEHQTRHVMALFNEHGIKDRAERIGRIGAIVGHDVTSWKDCTPDEADQVIDQLRTTRPTQEAADG